MIGAVCFKVTNEYEVRIYMVGTYEQIDWTNPSPCVLGENYTCYALKNEEAGNAIQIVTGLNGQHMLRLFETKRYILRLVYEENLDIEVPRFQNENNKFLKLEKDKDYITFQFVNYLGYSRINFTHDNCGQQIVFEIAPEKMNYEEDYIVLTEAIAQVCSELLLEYSGLTSNLFEQSEEEHRTILEQFIFLRQFCYGNNLFSVFEAIKRNPDRVLSSDEIYKPIGCGIPSQKFYTHPFSYGKGWQKTKRADGTFSIVPQMISVTQKQDSIDTPANRFVKYALEKFDSVCLELMNSLDAAGGVKQAECLSEAKAIHNMLDEIFNDGFFDKIGKLDIMPQNNQVLQKREGYSQIFSAYSMIDLALRLNWSGHDDVYEGESKNVALLYEYWLFFELYKIIDSIDGCKKVYLKDDDFLTVSDGGITILLQEGKKSRQSFVIERLHTKINLYYNRTFSRKESKGALYSRLNRMKQYTEMVLREPSVSLLNTADYQIGKKDENVQKGIRCVLGYIRALKEDDYYYSLVENNLLFTGAEFLFYFYAIKDSYVYSHHPDIFKTKRFCFYKNSIMDTKKYILEQTICEIESNELISKKELVERLNMQGYKTNERNHHADFYYILKVKVIGNMCDLKEIGVDEISLQNGNDAYSPHSPKIFYMEDLS